MENYWKLSDKIYFGNRHAVDELKDEVKAVLNLADNVKADEYNPTVLPASVKYFHYPISDTNPIAVHEFDDLVYILRLIWMRSYFPVLIHCRAGQERGPAVAALALQIIDGTYPGIARAKCEDEHQDVFRHADFQHSMIHFQELLEGDMTQGDPPRRTNALKSLRARPNFDGAKEFAHWMWMRKNCLPHPATILDLGCGNGQNLIWCRGDVYSGNYDMMTKSEDDGGIDWNPDCPRYCKDSGFGQEFYCLDVADMDKLAFGNATWDTVLCCDNLTKIPKERWVPVLAEASRVMRHRALITAWDECSPKRGFNIELDTVPNRDCRRFMPCWDSFRQITKAVFGDNVKYEKIYGYFTAAATKE